MEKAKPLVGRTTTLALDFSDLSKPFGGEGMEGMAMGWDLLASVAQGSARLRAVTNGQDARSTRRDARFLGRAWDGLR